MGFVELVSPPAFSTPETHIFENAQTAVDATKHAEKLSDEQINITYEIERTVREIRAGRWKRVALQFPDHMLIDSPRVFQALSRRLKIFRKAGLLERPETQENTVDSTESIEIKDATQPLTGFSISDTTISERQEDREVTLAILADTSYGACCVDEVAAEHAEADVVVHYGRSCLSPTARLPVIYVFTKPALNLDDVVRSFQEVYHDRDQKTILMADVPYQGYLSSVQSCLESEGYQNLFGTSIVHNTLSPLPNRTVPDPVIEDEGRLKNYGLFHISEPPSSLLLTLSSRVSGIEVYSTSKSTDSKSSNTSSTAALLRRRYAILTQVSRVPIIGILINTLSVKNYMTILSHLKQIIAAAGKKSYTFVVGKINAAKVANFSEVGGWVVIGCWESSLFDSKDFWKPVITPWELEMALRSDEDRLWTGAWEADFQKVLNDIAAESRISVIASGEPKESAANSHIEDEEYEESEPPEFDLRTGQYVSHTRPVKAATTRAFLIASSDITKSSNSLIKRANGDIAMIGSEPSPAADFFRAKRSWKGLGSDFEAAYDDPENGKGARIEQGRKGIARGYVGEQSNET